MARPDQTQPEGVQQNAVDPAHDFHIDKPAAGEIKVIPVDQAERLTFSFSSLDIRLIILDVDAVFIFSDGAKIIFPNLAFAEVGSHPPELVFTDTLLSPVAFLSKAEEVQLVEDPVGFQLSSTHEGVKDTENVGGQDVEQPVLPGHPFAPSAQLSAHSSDEGAAPKFIILRTPDDDTITSSTSSSAPSNPALPTPSSYATLSFDLFGIHNFSSSALGGGGELQKGGAATLAAETDSSYAVQYTPETLTGTAFDDVIYAENPDEIPAGAALRRLDIGIAMPENGWLAQTAIIQNLPAGFSILNATYSNGKYYVTMDPGGDPNHLVLDLRYVLPEDGAAPDSRGFLDSFTLNIQFLTNTGNGTVSVFAFQEFGIRPVNSAGDATYIDSATNLPVIVLASNPTGNIIDGGDGNDLLYAGAGADDVTGGNGVDTLNYSRSQSGVTVGLMFGAEVGGGYAENDSISGVENLIGSNYRDLLSGDNSDNVIEGGAGADVLEGAGGSDTLSYAGSSSGIIANLINGVGSAGDAAGDTFSGFENVKGSAHADNITGDNGANILDGGAGNDVLNGGDGNDTLLGGSGADTLNGGNGIDTADYSAAVSGVTVDLATPSNNAGEAAGDSYSSIENITGSAFNDTLRGNGGSNTLNGGSGNDILEGGAGADTLIGGNGNDTADYSRSASWVVVDLLNGTASGGDAQGDTLSGIENITGSADFDTLLGDGNANILRGGASDDYLEGRGGADILDGGAGTDTVGYYSSSSGVTADLENSSINTGDAAGDVYISIEDMDGSDNDDILSGNASDNYIYGNGGNDILSGRDGSDRLIGGAGNDTLYGGSGNDQLFGDNNDDVLNGGTGADVLNGGSGTDTADYSTAASGITADLTTPSNNTGDAAGDTYSSIENLTGSAFNDTLHGDSGFNTIDGGDGDDLIISDDGPDGLIGGDGVDTVSYAGSPAGVTVNLTTNVNTGGYAHLDVLTGIENVIGTADDDDITGDASDNMLVGGDGNDILDGADGNDLLVAGNGNDTLIGGNGTDIADFSQTSSAINASLNAGTYTTGNLEAGTLSSIERMIGTAYNDILIGDGGANHLNGGDGDDFLVGGAGPDALIGGNGIDTVSYAFSGSSVSINLNNGAGLGGDAQGDNLVGIENLIGTGFNDSLRGNSVANIIEGGNGSDSLYGEDGNDTLIGGASNDLLDGGNGNDTASYAGSASGVTVNLTTDVNTGGDADGDNLVSIENLIGSAFGDSLTGDANTNTLNGGDGDDVLEGRAGGDALIGGNGSDTASYVSSSQGVSVSLLTGSTSGGDAAGDTYSLIENLLGSNFDDTLTGDVSGNILNGRSGNDTLNGGDGDDILIGGAGADSLAGGNGTDTASYSTAASGVIASLTTPGSNTGDAAGDGYSSIENLEGSAFNDTLIGDASANALTGGEGADILEGRAGADTLNGGNGSDTASYEHATTGVTADLSTPANNSSEAAGDTYISIENLTGSAFDDVLIGNNTDNILTGGDGNDLLEGLGGADQLVGGNGIDTANYSNSAVGVTVNLAGAGSSGDATGDTYSSVENVLGSSHNDDIKGSTDANTLYGLNGDDILDGGDGDDILNGGSGADAMNGGNGNDTASYADASTDVIVDLVTPASNTGEALGDTYVSIENIEGSAHNDELYGDNGNNVLTGGTGDDHLEGRDGNDTLLGGANDDYLVGGAGADVLNGGDEVDTASYVNSASAVTVDLGAGTGSGGDATGDTLSNIENLIGSAFDDTLTGDAGSNSISGGDGADVLHGGGGVDSLNGGDGDDILFGDDSEGGFYGDAGTDTVSYATSLAGVALSLLGGGISGDAAGDGYYSVENVIGSNYDDIISGNGIDNVIDGGDGDDTLEGGDGADTLIGGNGVDAISYANSLSGVVMTLDGSAGVGGDAQGDTATGVENIIG
ncbi:MAG: hypothetical protein V4691_10045, partial [Pseudomonadota bacterium]